MDSAKKEKKEKQQQKKSYRPSISVSFPTEAGNSLNLNTRSTSWTRNSGIEFNPYVTKKKNNKKKIEMNQNETEHNKNKPKKHMGLKNKA